MPGGAAPRALLGVLALIIAFAVAVVPVVEARPKDRNTKQDKVADWQWAQKRFEKLHLHRKQRNGLNIWTCEVTGPRKARRLHGYLLQDPHRLFADLPPNNPYLSIVP